MSATSFSLPSPKHLFFTSYYKLHIHTIYPVISYVHSKRILQVELALADHFSRNLGTSRISYLCMRPKRSFIISDDANQRANIVMQSTEIDSRILSANISIAS